MILVAQQYYELLSLVIIVVRIQSEFCLHFRARYNRLDRYNNTIITTHLYAQVMSRACLKSLNAAHAPATDGFLTFRYYNTVYTAKSFRFHRLCS